MSGAAISSWTSIPGIQALDLLEEESELMSPDNLQWSQLAKHLLDLAQKAQKSNEFGAQFCEVPENPARVTKSTGSTYEVYGIHGIGRDEANQLIVALDRFPTLRYIAIDLMRLVHPLLDEEDYSYE